MALRETVLGEFREQLEDRFRLVAVDVVGDGAGDEAVALRRHLGADLLAHRAAQVVGFRHRVAGEDLRDLHHLLLVGR